MLSGIKITLLCFFDIFKIYRSACLRDASSEDYLKCDKTELAMKNLPAARRGRFWRSPT